jgi:hypothetical protein
MEVEGLKGPAAGAPPRPVSGPSPESPEAKQRRLAIQNKQGVKEAFDQKRDIVGQFKRRAVGALSRAFTEIEKAHYAKQRDVAASKANFAGQELDQLMRELAQSLLGGNNER